MFNEISLILKIMVIRFFVVSTINEFFVMFNEFLAACNDWTQSSFGPFKLRRFVIFKIWKNMSMPEYRRNLNLLPFRNYRFNQVSFLSMPSNVLYTVWVYYLSHINIKCCLLHYERSITIKYITQNHNKYYRYNTNYNIIAYMLLKVSS